MNASMGKVCVKTMLHSANCEAWYVGERGDSMMVVAAEASTFILPLEIITSHILPLVPDGTGTRTVASDRV